MSYTKGTPVKVAAAFFDEAGVAVNPSVVVCVVKKPDGTKRTYTYGVDVELVQIDNSPPTIPTYYLWITTDQAGRWAYEFTGSGTVDATSGGGFDVTEDEVDEDWIEPITLDEAALNLHADASYESSRIKQLITVARMACENELEVSLVAKTLEVRQDSFTAQFSTSRDPKVGFGRLTYPLGIELPNGPVRSVVSVTYHDSDGATQTLASDQYRFGTINSKTFLYPAYNVTWPTARCDIDSVRVRYTVGYPSTDSPPETVPEPIRQAMHLYIAHYFANREAVDDKAMAELPLGVKSLLWADTRRLGLA